MVRLTALTRSARLWGLTRICEDRIGRRIGHQPKLLTLPEEEAASLRKIMIGPAA
jgi:hypothetical protein